MKATPSIPTYLHPVEKMDCLKQKWESVGVDEVVQKDLGEVCDEPTT
jgi:hypothetical protein